MLVIDDLLDAAINEDAVAVESGVEAAFENMALSAEGAEAGVHCFSMQRVAEMARESGVNTSVNVRADQR